MMKKILLTLFYVFLSVHSIQFDVHPGERRCIFDDFTKGQVIKGTFKIPQISFMQMSIKIHGPDKEDTALWANPDASEGTYAFTANEDGVYRFCFSDKPRAGVKETGKPVTRRITFTAEEGWVSLDDKETVEKGELKPVEYLFRSIEDKMDFLRRELKESRRRETENHYTLLSTNWRIPTLSSFTVILLIGCGILQILYLRSYFRKKKII